MTQKGSEERVRAVRKEDSANVGSEEQTLSLSNAGGAVKLDSKT